MASTKFRFEVIGAEKVLSTLKELTNAHNAFAAEVIAAEQKLTSAIKENIQERISLYSAYQRAVSAVQRGSASDVKRILQDELKTVKDEASEEVKVEGEKQRKIRKEREDTHRDTLRWYGRGGLSMSGGIYGTAGVSAVGVAGMGLAVASTLVTAITGALKGGIDNAISFGKDQFQAHVREETISQSIYSNAAQGSEARKAGKSGIETWAMEASNATGLDREEIQKAQSEFQKRGGALNGNWTRILAQEMKSDPSQNPSEILGKLANPDTGLSEKQALETYHHMRYMATAGGFTAQQIGMPSIQLGSKLAAEGMYGGDTAAAIQDVARKMEQLSVVYKTPQQLQTAMARFEDRVQLTQKGKSQGIDVRGKTLDEIDAEFLKSHKIDFAKGHVLDQFKAAGISSSVAQQYIDLNESKEGKNPFFDKTDIPASEAFAKENLESANTGDIADAMKAYTQITNSLYVMASPAIAQAAAFLSEHKVEIEMVFQSLVDMFKSIMSVAIAHPDMIKEYIATMFGGVGAEALRWGGGKPDSFAHGDFVDVMTSSLIDSTKEGFIKGGGGEHKVQKKVLGLNAEDYVAEDVYNIKDPRLTQKTTAKEREQYAQEDIQKNLQAIKDLHLPGAVTINVIGPSGITTQRILNNTVEKP